MGNYDALKEKFADTKISVSEAKFSSTFMDLAANEIIEHMFDGDPEYLYISRALIIVPSYATNRIFGAPSPQKTEETYQKAFELDVNDIFDVMEDCGRFAVNYIELGDEKAIPYGIKQQIYALVDQVNVAFLNLLIPLATIEPDAPGGL